MIEEWNRPMEIIGMFPLLLFVVVVVNSCVRLVVDVDVVVDVDDDVDVDGSSSTMEGLCNRIVVDCSVVVIVVLKYR